MLTHTFIVAFSFLQTLSPTQALKADVTAALGAFVAGYEDRLSTSEKKRKAEEDLKAASDGKCAHMEKKSTKDHQLIEEMQDVIAALKKEVFDETQSNLAKDQQIISKDLQITNITQDGVSKDLQNAALTLDGIAKDQQIVAKDLQISTLTQDGVTKDLQIVSKDLQIATLTQDGIAKDQQIVAKDLQISTLTQDGATKDQQIVSKDLQIATLTQDVATERQAHGETKKICASWHATARGAIMLLRDGRVAKHAMTHFVARAGYAPEWKIGLDRLRVGTARGQYGVMQETNPGPGGDYYRI
jgi:uncharacterized protein (DUF3084 family)